MTATPCTSKLPTLESSEDFVADSGWGLTVVGRQPDADVAWDFAAFATLEVEQAAVER